VRGVLGRTEAEVVELLCAIESLTPASLTKDVGDDSVGDPGDDTVFSFRHRTLSDAHAAALDVTESAIGLIQQILGGVLEVTTTDSPSVPTCRVCGCTAEFACEGGCSWAGRNLCTRCYESCERCFGEHTVTMSNGNDAFLEPCPLCAT